MNYSPEFIDAMKKLDELSPMKSFVVSSEDDVEGAVEKMKEVGLRVACVSSAGLPKPYLRLTFLPESAFTDAAIT